MFWNYDFDCCALTGLTNNDEKYHYLTIEEAINFRLIHYLACGHVFALIFLALFVREISPFSSRSVFGTCWMRSVFRLLCTRGIVYWCMWKEELNSVIIKAWAAYHFQLLALYCRPACTFSIVGQKFVQTWKSYFTFNVCFRNLSAFLKYCLTSGMFLSPICILSSFKFHVMFSGLLMYCCR